MAEELTEKNSKLLPFRCRYFIKISPTMNSAFLLCKEGRNLAKGVRYFANDLDHLARLLLTFSLNCSSFLLFAGKSLRDAGPENHINSVGSPLGGRCSFIRGLRRKSRS